MNSYRQILYHIVFCTHDRHRTLPPEHHPELYKYVQGVVKNRNCTLYQINGTENHVHLLSDLHPIICLADFIKEIKTATNFWMKSTGNYPSFHCWSAGYAALTYGYRDKNSILRLKPEVIVGEHLRCEGDRLLCLCYLRLKPEVITGEHLRCLK